jgi:hypothetical protein
MPRRTPSSAFTLALLAPLVLAGYGSALSDSQALGNAARPAPYTGSIRLTSEPPGARCVLTQAATNSPVAEATTPATIPLPRGTAIIDAACTAPASMPTTVAIRPVRDFAANIHHPQPVGTGLAQNLAAVQSGRTRHYNDTVIHLPPQPFASAAAARDAWFADRATQIRAAAAPAIAQAQRAPGATIDSAETLAAYLAADLARLQQQEALATVAAPESASGTRRR